MAVKIGRSAKLFQERRGLCLTERGPGPIWAPGANQVHTLKTSAPLPPPELLEELGTGPDQGSTPVWPHGKESII